MRLSVPPIILALALALLLAAPFAFLAGRRGGRFRGMPGWVGFWTFFGGLLVCLSRAEFWISFPFLAALMFAGLREYFFLAPIRPQDRWAILVAYLSIPCSLYPAYIDSYSTFTVVVSVVLVLLLPAVLSAAPRQSGLLDSMGRVLLGSLLFVFCAAHLGLMAHQPRGRLELFAILVLMAELPQRLAGRPGPGMGFVRSMAALVTAIALDMGIGAWLGPLGSVTPMQGTIAGLLVALAVTAGALVAGAVAEDLKLTASSSLVGRGAFLDRSVPAMYAAPVFYNFLKYFG